MKTPVDTSSTGWNDTIGGRWGHVAEEFRARRVQEAFEGEIMGASTRRRVATGATAAACGVVVLSSLSSPARAVVFPPDNRVRTNPTTNFPYNAIVSIDSPGGFSTDCTGWFYAANGVATAAHCIYNRNIPGYLGGDGDFVIAPGRFQAGNDGTAKPYGYCISNRRRVLNDFIVNGSAVSDYGALRVDCSWGTATGPFVIANTISTSAQIEVAGYPLSDRPPGALIGQQWKAAGTTIATLDGGARITHNVDTSGGQSGSPMFYNGGGWDNQALAIHTGGNPDRNSGVALTTAVRNQLNSWLV